jgi:ABC-2 type transport system ATP-binding protein
MVKGKDTEADVAIKVSNLSKTFILPHEKQSSLKGAAMKIFSSKSYEKQEALKDISFEIKKGDFFGIVGRNGSGKSTLLKLMAGIYTPTEGEVTVNGSLIPFIELGVGFNHELSGRENVFLNGALLGFTRKQMQEMYDEIVEFAELERFMDQKLKNYSSGMLVRLAFSIAIRADSDILLLDEVLAVGDEAFQRKCNEYFEKIRRDKNTTVILVTHSMESVRRYCNKAMLLANGKVEAYGPPGKAANAYSRMFIDEQIAQLESEDKKKTINKELSDVGLREIGIVQNNKKVKTVNFRKDFSLELDIASEEKRENLTMGVHFFDQAGRDMLAITTKALGGFSLKKGRNKIFFDIQNIFTDGSYYINLAIEDNDTGKLLVQRHEISPFSIAGLNLSEQSKNSLTHPEVKMRLE